MTDYIGKWRLTENHILEVEEGVVYPVETPEQEEWLAAMLNNSPGCLVPAGKAAPQNRMETGPGIQNRSAAPAVEANDDGEDGPVSTLGQNPGDSFALLPVDATAGAISYAEANGINLKELYRKLERRVTLTDVKAYQAEQEEDE